MTADLDLAEKRGRATPSARSNRANAFPPFPHYAAPAGAKPRQNATVFRRFVVQKHNAPPGDAARSAIDGPIGPPYVPVSLDQKGGEMVDVDVSAGAPAGPQPLFERIFAFM